MKRIFTIAILGAAATFILFSCNKENSLEKLRKTELSLLDEFIGIHYPDSIPKPSGLYYIEEKQGTGDSVFIGDRVQIFFSYWINGGADSSEVVDETYGFMQGIRLEPDEFTVFPAMQLDAENATSILLTPGLHEAITYMREGTVANLVLPSEIAFGTNGNYVVSGFSTILMRLEVYKVYKPNE